MTQASFDRRDRDRRRAGGVAPGRLVPGLAVVVVLAVLALGACGRRHPVTAPGQPLPVAPALPDGACADPERDGVVSERPALKRADQDLDGDRTPEVVVADRALCTAEGNCHWNLFRRQDGCYRYLGTVAAARMQRVPRRGEDGLFGLRTWWNLTGDGRLLLQEYGYRRGGYRVVEVLLCRQADDDRVLCAEGGEGKEALNP